MEIPYEKCSNFTFRLFSFVLVLSGDGPHGRDLHRVRLLQHLLPHRPARAQSVDVFFRRGEVFDE